MAKNKAKVSPGGDGDDDTKVDIDEGLKNGPLNKRNCTDIMCCLVFIAFIGGLFITTSYGLTLGDPQLIVTGWDFDGNGCGYSELTKDYPYLYWPAPDISDLDSLDTTSIDPTDITQIFRYGVCVQECPTIDSVISCVEPSFFETSDQFEDCQYWVYGDSSSEYNQALRYDTIMIGESFCVPDPTKIAENEELKEQLEAMSSTYAEIFYGNAVGEAFADCIAVYDVILWMMLAAAGFGFVYMLIIRIFGGPIIYVSILLILLGLGAGGYYCYNYSANYEETDNMYKAYLYGSYFIWGLDACLVCCVCCYRNALRLAISIFQVTADFISNTMRVLFVPPIFFVFVVFWFIVWTFSATYVWSVGEPVPREDYPFLTEIIWTDETRYVFLYHLFGFLWINAFLIGLCQFTLAVTCCTWYYTCNSDTKGSGSVSTGLWWTFRYHLGSIAFGSFIIAVVQMIRIIFEYYKKQIQKFNKTNPVVKAMLCITSCCLQCLERFIKFITKNAYIQIALTSKNFCASAWNAFTLILKNAARFGFAKGVGAIFMTLGKLLITVVTGYLCYYMLENNEEYSTKINSWIGPVIVSGILAYYISNLFLSVFSFSADTILQCFLVDEELKRPESNRPPSLNKFIAENSK